MSNSPGLVGVGGVGLGSVVDPNFMANPAVVGLGLGGLNAVGNNALLGNGGSPGSGLAGGNGSIRETDLWKIFNNMQQIIVELDSLVQDVHVYITQCHALQNYCANQNQREFDLQEEAHLLMQRRPLIVASLWRIYKNYQESQEKVINELHNWRRNQMLSGNGLTFTDNLDDIQRCFELLEIVVTRLLQCIKELLMFRALDEDSQISQLMGRVQNSMQSLVLTAFIVDKQPPQVMKTNTKFAAAVRWLVGSQLGIHLNPPQVECVILSESQAYRFVTQRNDGGICTNVASQNSGEILNNITTMEYQQNTHVFSASFRSMQLKKIKRAEKKGTESVMDEKFALLFSTSTIVNDYQIRVWTLSLPVVVIVHGNQEPQSWATITWDNAFADIIRDPFVVTDHVTWIQLSIALNTKFGHTTGRSLTNENIEFFCEKLIRSDNMTKEHSALISWNQFCKEQLPDRTFTFWDWFFAIMKLTKDHLLGLWKEGLIIGFINKARATEQLLRSNRAGTFLLRFSDSELGGISVAFLNETKNVLMCEPWTARHLNIRNLADRIHDLTVLHYLIPADRNMTHIPRDVAFSNFYTQRSEEQTTRVDGYVTSEIQVRVPATENGLLSGNTPQHIMQSPHPQQDITMGTYNYGCSNSPATTATSYNPCSVAPSFDESDSDDSGVNVDCVNFIQDYLMTNVNDANDPVVEAIRHIVSDNLNNCYDLNDYGDMQNPNPNANQNPIQFNLGIGK